MTFDLEAILRSKRALRDKLAARTFAEKLRLVEAMRERTLAIRAGRDKARSLSGAGESPITE